MCVVFYTNCLIAVCVKYSIIIANSITPKVMGKLSELHIGWNDRKL